MEPPTLTAHDTLNATLRVAVVALGLDPEYWTHDFRLDAAAAHVSLSPDELRAVLIEAAGAQGNTAVPAALIEAQTIGEAVYALASTHGETAFAGAASGESEGVPNQAPSQAPPESVPPPPAAEPPTDSPQTTDADAEEQDATTQEAQPNAQEAGSDAEPHAEPTPAPTGSKR